MRQLSPARVHSTDQERGTDVDVMVRDSAEAAGLLSVETMGRIRMVLNLTEVQPGFPRVRAS